MVLDRIFSLSFFLTTEFFGQKPEWMAFPCHLFEQLTSLDKNQYVAPLLARLLNLLSGWSITYAIHGYLNDFRISPQAHPTLDSGAWGHPFIGGHPARDIGSL